MHFKQCIAAAASLAQLWKVLHVMAAILHPLGAKLIILGQIVSRFVLLRRFAVVPASTNVQPRMMQEMLCSPIITEALVKNSAKPTGLISQLKSPHRMTGREKETTMTVTMMKCFVSDPTAMGSKVGTWQMTSPR
jgi:hypothetical protein